MLLFGSSSPFGSGRLCGRRLVSAARACRSPLAHHAVQGKTPRISGSSLSAQARYAAGTLETLQDFFEGRPIRPEYRIVDGGKLAGTGASSYKLA